jgi:hypothetical protein
MSEKPIHLQSLHFPKSDQSYTPPDRAVVEFPVDTLYVLASVAAFLPPFVFTPAASTALRNFYSFVTGEVANRFYEDGLSDAMPGYEVRAGTHILAYFPVGLKDAEAPQQQLAEQFAEIIANDPSSGELRDAANARDLAVTLAQAVINAGWRVVTQIGR